MDVPADVTAWLRDQTRAFATTEPVDDLDDLGWFAEVVGDARVVALGEATHGTHEFFTMKHRLVQFLVTRMGFDMFAIEASMPHAEPVGRYVRGVAGDPGDLLAGLGFWTWHTEEVRDLVEWLRASNARGGGQVGFEGFDLQAPGGSCDRVVEYLTQVDPRAADRARAAYAPFQVLLPAVGLSRASFLLSDREARVTAALAYARAPARSGRRAGATSKPSTTICWRPGSPSRYGHPRGPSRVPPAMPSLRCSARSCCARRRRCWRR